MIIEVSIAIIALAFVILVVYVIGMTKKINTTLDLLTPTITEIRTQLYTSGEEVKKVLESANQVTVDLKNKMELTNSLFNALSRLGEACEHKIVSYNRSASLVDEEIDALKFTSSKIAHEQRKKELSAVTELLELIGLGIRLWQKFKKNGGKQ